MSFNNTNTDILVVRDLYRFLNPAVLIYLKGRCICSFRSRPFGLSA